MEKCAHPCAMTASFEECLAALIKPSAVMSCKQAIKQAFDRQRSNQILHQFQNMKPQQKTHMCFVNIFLSDMLEMTRLITWGN